MKAIALTLTLLASTVFAQTVPPTSDNSLLARAQRALEKHFSADIAVTYDGKEMNVARSDIRVEWLAGKKFRVWARVNILPLLPGTEEKIVLKLNENEDIIRGVSGVIYKTVQNQIAAQLGVPAEFVPVPAPLLAAALAQNLKPAVAAFVDGKITEEAKLAAALREVAVAFSVVGDADTPNQLVLEGGKLEPMLMQDNGYFVNYFAVSAWGFRASFRRDITENLSVKGYITGTDDPGLWRVRDPRANPNAGYIAAVIAGESAKLFNLSEIDAYEAGVITTHGGQVWAIAVGTRPVLNRGVDSRYLLTRYDTTIKGFKVYAQGSLEQFDDPTYGETLVKQFEGGVSRQVGRFVVGGKADSSYDTFFRKDYATIQGSLTANLWKGIGVGVRIWTYQYHGVDDNGDRYNRNEGFDAGIAWKFRQTRPNPADVLAKEEQRKQDAERKRQDALKKQDPK